MTEEQVNSLLTKGLFNGKPLHGKLVETHISWVILTDQFVFKIKKPLKLSFLDYSSLELRKENCEKEILLNSRYTDIYLEVLSIRHLNGKWFINGDKGEILDHLVQMKRMDTALEMDKLLQEDKVKEAQIKSLADVISTFHQRAEITYHPFDIQEARLTFNDLHQAIEIVNKELGSSYIEIIHSAINWSDNFLKKHHGRFAERVELGYQRDVHGDLHSGNIFLYDTPILFDGIEFNEEFRQIDLLYEIAFLCMDLEAFGKDELAVKFLEYYHPKLKCIIIEEDEAIFTYYKCLRANIRAKVHAVSAHHAHDDIYRYEHLNEIKKYLSLIRRYMGSGI